MGTVFSVAVTIMILGFLWFFVARPILEDYGVIAPRAVNDYQLTIELAPPVMSHETGQTKADEARRDPDERVSEADRWIDRIEVDRTRATWVELMVYAGYSVGEIRGLLKGDNGAIGAEVDAARKRLGISLDPRQLRVRDETGERLIPMEGR